MAQYIDKDALVAEIERRKEEEVDYDESSKNFSSYADQIHYFALDSIENFINTLEVKEVDLDKEVDDVMKRFLGNITCREEQLNFAKHFFELGLKARKI